MKLVCTSLGHDVDHAAGDIGVLSAVVVGLNPEFLNRLDLWTVLGTIETDVVVPGPLR